MAAAFSSEMTIPMYRAACRAPEVWLRVVLVFTALLLGINDSWLVDLFSAFVGLQEVVYANPVREWMFKAFNFLVMGVLLLSSWKMNQKREKTESSDTPPVEDFQPSSSGSPFSDRPAGLSAFFVKPSAPPMPKDWEPSETPPTGTSCGRPTKRSRHENSSPFYGASSAFPSPTVSPEPSAPPMRAWEPMDCSSGEDGNSAAWSPDSFSSASAPEPSASLKEALKSTDGIWEAIKREPRLSKNRTWNSSAGAQPHLGRDEEVRGRVTRSETFHGAPSWEQGPKGWKMEMQEAQDEMDRRFTDFISEKYAEFRRQPQDSFRRHQLDISDLLRDADLGPISLR